MTPASPDRAPRGWGFFAGLSGLMIVVGVICGGLDLASLTGPEAIGERLEEITYFHTHRFFLLYAAGVTIVPYGLGLVMPRRPGVRVYDLVLVCGVTVSIVFFPLAWGVMVEWPEPEMKCYFGRTPQSPNMLDEPL